MKAGVVVLINAFIREVGADCCCGCCPARLQFPKELEGDAVRLIHHSTMRKDDLVSKLHEALKATRTTESDQQKGAAADQQQEEAQQQADTAAKPSSGTGITKKLLTHFLLYVSF